MNKKKRSSAPVSIAAAAVVGLLLFGGIGIGFSSGIGAGDNSITTNADAITDSISPSPPTSAPTSTPVAVPSANSGTEEMIVIPVTVVKNDYFYNNKMISLDALLDELCTFEGAYIVEIVDDNASLKAYNALIDALIKNKISYTELPN